MEDSCHFFLGSTACHCMLNYQLQKEANFKRKGSNLCDNAISDVIQRHQINGSGYYIIHLLLQLCFVPSTLPFRSQVVYVNNKVALALYECIHFTTRKRHYIYICVVNCDCITFQRNPTSKLQNLFSLIMKCKNRKWMQITFDFQSIDRNFFSLGLEQFQIEKRRLEGRVFKYLKIKNMTKCSFHQFEQKYSVPKL